MTHPASKSAQPRWLTWAALGVCALAVWVVFGAARHGAFVLWDDNYNIQDNPHLGGVTWDNLRWMFTDTAYSRRYFPLTWLGWNIEHDLFGLTAYSAHLGNILFHLLNTVLLYFVIKAALRIWVPAKNLSNPWCATVAATLGTLLWSLHPLRVEVVAWASGRIYGQAACFLLLSTWAYLRSLEAPPASTTARRWRWASVAALALSLLTYPLALGFVGVVLVVDLYRPGRVRPPPGTSWLQRVRPVLVEIIPFFAVTVLMLGVTLWARTNVAAVGWHPPVSLAEFGVIPRLMQACYVWTYYFAKPWVPFHLSPYYTELLAFSPADAEFVLSLLCVVLLTAVLFWRRRQMRGLWLLWLCHLLFLVPVLGLTEHPHFTNDRYSYLAAVPWCIGLSVLIVQLGLRSFVVPTLLVVIAIFSWLSVAQVAIWRNTETLGLHMIAEMGDHPRRFEIYRRISTSLRAEGKIPESNAYHLKYLAADPQAVEGALGQARQFETEGRAQDAFAQYLLASQLRPELAEPKFRMGTILMQQNRAADALPLLKDAARLEPGSSDIQITLGWAFNWTHQSPEAIPHLEAGLRLNPEDVAGHSGLGVALVAIGKPWEAIPHFQEVIRQHPDAPLAHMQLGLALLDGLGRKADAAAQFEIVLKLQADFPGAREALARCKP